jgi:putative endonuclease
MKTERQIVGRKGEEEACRYLMDRGHVIVERNWRSSHLETDIISFDRQGVHFVEVKSRTAPVMAAPEVNVDRSKQMKMVAAARSYVHGKGREWMRDSELFFDVVTVVFNGEEIEIEYYPQAFIPLYV